jgi:Restriction endonuclease
MTSGTQTWRSYEELARHVLMCFADMLGISEVEAKQRLMGATGTEWEIDAKGVKADGRGFLVVECKERSAARLDQATIGSLAFTVQDVGAQGAVIVTSIGLQEGAKKIAEHQDFKIVFLRKESTFEQFFASCGNCLLAKVSDHATSSLALTGFVVSKAEGK